MAFNIAELPGSAARSVRRMLRLERVARLDIPDIFRPVLPVYASQILFAAACGMVAIGLRLLTDMVLPGAGPFALMVPTVLVATLFGRLFSGLVCLAMTSLYAWYYVLPIQASFALQNVADGPRVLVNIASGFFCVLLAEVFRHTMKQALVDREMLLLEIEHRVKNNFATVASMLRLQIRETQSSETTLELQAALGRVESFARANTSLYRNFFHTGTIDMGVYLRELCGSLQSSFGADNEIRFHCDAASVQLPRDRAILIGLLVNEVANNSVKHAFHGQAQGQITVRFDEQASDYRLSVSDDGRGMKDETRDGALGMTLLDALAKQADGTVEIESSSRGTRFTFALAK